MYVSILFFLIHFDYLCVLIGVIRPLMFKLITDIVQLVSTIFVTVFISCPFSLLYCLLLLPASFGFVCVCDSNIFVLLNFIFIGV